jgi:hypothetical protein
MTKYLNTKTNEYPRHSGDLELLGWSSGESLPEDWAEVQETIAPEINEGQTAKELAPALIEGIWTQQWEVHTLTAEELAFDESQKPKMPWEELPVL